LQSENTIKQYVGYANTKWNLNYGKFL